MQITKIEPLVWEVFTGNFKCMVCKDREASKKVGIKDGVISDVRILTCEPCLELSPDEMMVGLTG